ncbi:MAG TPA: hypothetical protein VHA52_00125, partial [Candidatus Babeliaceae bacterium]|nr:hypothetical protein [Candidatus Babeliaceae bacterium]
MSLLLCGLSSEAAFSSIGPYKDQYRRTGIIKNNITSYLIHAVYPFHPQMSSLLLFFCTLLPAKNQLPMIRKLAGLLLGLAAIAPAFAQEPPAFWEDQYKNEYNREPMHATYFAYGDRAAALKNDPWHAENYQSLNGTWKFKWVDKPDDRPLGFWKNDYDDSKWDNFKVPATWEVNGYGVPI